MPAIITPDQDAVVSEIEIGVPADRDFQALTDVSQLKRWFGSTECPVKFWEMDPRLGGRYRYATQKGTIVVNNVSEFECHGEITDYDPPRVLAHTWIGNRHDEPARCTLVRWDLTPTASGTHVKVTHSGLTQLPSPARTTAGVGPAWSRF